MIEWRSNWTKITFLGWCHTLFVKTKIALVSIHVCECSSLYDTPIFSTYWVWSYVWKCSNVIITSTVHLVKILLFGRLLLLYPSLEHNLRFTWCWKTWVCSWALSASILSFPTVEFQVHHPCFRRRMHLSLYIMLLTVWKSRLVLHSWIEILHSIDVGVVDEQDLTKK